MDKDIIKIFISQPMGFKSEEEILREAGEAIEKAKEIILGELPAEENPRFAEYTALRPGAGELPPIRSLSSSIQLMGQADFIIFAKGWMESRECRIERRIAREYRLKVIDLDTES